MARTWQDLRCSLVHDKARKPSALWFPAKHCPTVIAGGTDQATQSCPQWEDNCARVHCKWSYGPLRDVASSCEASQTNMNWYLQVPSMGADLVEPARVQKGSIQLHRTPSSYRDGKYEGKKHGVDMSRYVWLKDPSDGFHQLLRWILRQAAHMLR